MSALDVGRELDALVAEKVMGYEWWRSSTTGRRAIFAHGEQADWFPERADGTEGLAAFWDQCPHFSTEIAAATLVAERLREKLRLCYVIGTSAYSPQNGVKFYEGFRGVGRDIFNAEQHEGWYAVANTIPLAICRAALEVVASPQFYAAGVSKSVAPHAPSPSPLAQTSRGDAR